MRRTMIFVAFVVVASVARADSLIDIALVEARTDLANLGYVDALTVDVTGVQILELRGRMPCAGAKALGCFATLDVPVGESVRTYGVMAYRRVAPSEGFSYSSLRKVLVHEWKHALLWKLGDVKWDVHDERFR